MKAILDSQEVVPSDADVTLTWEALISTAVADGVSDIHVCAQREAYALAFRLDGVLRPRGRFSHEFARRLIGHIKSVAGMDVAESRRPTEGRMKIPLGDKTVDLRISIIPTLHGQDVVVRIFDGTLRLLDLSSLGLWPEQLATLRDALSRPSGLVLVCGPSGGGKTTTLYAMLRELADTGRKIVTIEDPVEYDIDGVNQTQVNPRIGVTFGRMLTAILRQDPDVILVGEIRDEETAVTAVRAANTGHLVLASTHATKASRAIETMLSLSTHPYFLSVALRCIVAQVLVRKICPQCRTPLPETADMILEPAMARRLGPDTRPQLVQGVGCEACLQTGYRGRQGLFEVFPVDEPIRRLIAGPEPSAHVEAASAANGMLTLEQAGRLAAVAGQTTLEEAVSVLPMA